MTLKLIFHIVEISHHSICRCIVAVYAPTHNSIVLYTYITKPDTTYTSDPICSTATARTCQQTAIIVRCYDCE